MESSLLTKGYVLAGVLLGLLVSACSGGEERTLSGNTSAPVNPSWVPVAESCQPGAVRACGVELDAREGVVTCYKGSQTCDQGAWGECANGSIETKSAPSGSFRTLSLSSPVECADSPCDPGCEVFEEKPAQPIESVADDPVYPWQTGVLAEFPNGLVKKGLVEPCETGSDCQFNTYCAAPSAGRCSHGVCETGAPLAEDCSECVTKVCAKNAACCEQPVEVDTCAHDPCARGAALKNGCNSCVTQICAQNPSCCDKNGTWNDTCVDAVASICGNSCECEHGEAYNGRCYEYLSTARRWSSARSACEDVSDHDGWDLVSIEDAAENTFVRQWGDANNVWIGFTDQNPPSSTSNTWKWTNGLPSGSWRESPRGGIYTAWTSTSEPGSGERCAIMEKAKSGKWNGKSCNDSYAAVCEGPPERMVKKPEPPPSWSSACVDLVATECDAACDEEDPANTAGSCTPWYPGDTDPSCPGVDLAVGVPCDGVIPVCNHGNTEAPSGVKIVHFPANSQQYPLTNPSQSHPQMRQCFTSKPIPPGECVEVTDCPGLSGNREIMVNPGAGLSECSQADNWSLYSAGATCGAPICAGGNSAASMIKLPVDIIIAIDNSASMQGEIQSVQARINDDLASIIEASGIDYRVIMVSRYGNVHVTNYDGGVASDSAYSVCIGAPLSSITCPTDDDDKTWPVANTTPRFYHHSTDIGSNNMWCRLLESYTKADAYPVARSGWTSVAPSGWGAFLREGSFKIFVGITDDDPYATSTTYTHGSKTLYRDCPNMLGDSSLDGTNDEEGARDFDTAIRRLDPDQFQKEDGSRNYVWYSIAGMTGSSTTPLKPTDPIEKRCCRKDGGVDNTCQGSTGQRVDDAANSGVGYQHLSRLTGGLRYPSCYHNNFDAIFNAIAQDVIVTASASCDVVVESDTPFDPELATVVYSSVDKQGKDVSTTLTQVADAAACTSNAWYHSGVSGSSTIKLCPSTCNTVKADVNARVWAQLACGTESSESVQTFLYESQCRADQSVVWLDLGYESALPGDASLVFRARVAADKASLREADWVELRTATGSQEHCPLGEPCAVDVYQALGADNAILPALELEISLHPSSSGGTASLTSWDLTYSCSENQ